MRAHVIVDFSFIYYKYKTMVDNGRMHHLSAMIDGEECDVSLVYYCLREIEKFRKETEARGFDVTMSICFDMPTERNANNFEGNVESLSEAASKYKANRANKLGETDFERMRFIQEILSRVGYNTYRVMHYEADDIVNYLVKNYAGSFDATVIYTIDLDILVNVSEKPFVAVSRFKARKGYTLVTANNFSNYVGTELKCNMSFNGIMLFKCTAGDKSDQIDGIKKFGPKSFNELVEYLNNMGIDWSLMSDWRYVETLLNTLHLKGYFSDIQFKEAMDSLSLVKPMEFEDGVIGAPAKNSSLEKRQEVYGQYNMKSLIA